MEKKRSRRLKRTNLEQVQHCTDLAPGHICSVHWTGKDEARVRMSVSAHQKKKKKKKNEKTGKRKTGEERKQTTGFKEAACCPPTFVQGQHGEKMVCLRGVIGQTGTLGKNNSHFDATQTVSGTAPLR